MDEFQVIVMPDGEEIEFPANMSDDDIAAAIKSMSAPATEATADTAASRPDAQPAPVPTPTDASGAPVTSDDEPMIPPGVLSASGLAVKKVSEKVPEIAATTAKVLKSTPVVRGVSGLGSLAGGALGYTVAGPGGGMIGMPAGYWATHAAVEKGGKALETAAEQVKHGVKNPITEVLRRSVELENKAASLGPKIVKAGAKPTEAQRVLTKEATKLARQGQRMTDANTLARTLGQKLPHVTPKLTTLAKMLRVASKVGGPIGNMMTLYDLYNMSRGVNARLGGAAKTEQQAKDDEELMMAIAGGG